MTLPSLLRGVLDAIVITAAILALCRPWFPRALVIGWRLDGLQKRHARYRGEIGDRVWCAYSEAFFVCRRTFGPHTWSEFREAWRSVSRARAALLQTRDGRMQCPNFRREPTIHSSRGGAR